MGDMGELFNAQREATKLHRAEKLARANTEGWTRHTEWHFSRTFPGGGRVDWWPSTGKASHKGKMVYGHRKVAELIRKLSGKPMAQVEKPARVKCPYCKAMVRPVGLADHVRDAHGTKKEVVSMPTFTPEERPTVSATPAVKGIVVAYGSDESGQPRILIHTTREALRDGPMLAYRDVQITPVAAPVEPTAWLIMSNGRVVGYTNADTKEYVRLADGETMVEVFDRPAPPEYFELMLCEQANTVLQAGRNYRFSVDPECGRCLDIANGVTTPNAAAADLTALAVAREFTHDSDPMARAKLQLAVLNAMEIAAGRALVHEHVTALDRIVGSHSPWTKPNDINWLENASAQAKFARLPIATQEALGTLSGMVSHFGKLHPNDVRRAVEHLTRAALDAATAPQPPLAALIDAGTKMLEHRIGRLPSSGYIRDNDESRKDIAAFADALEAARVPNQD